MSHFQITVVCLGNICRSPIAEAVVRHRLAAAGLAEHVRVDSAGTGDWHLGYPVDPRAQATLARHGYALEHRARQIDPTWFAGIDLALAMDTANYADLRTMLDAAGTRTEVRMLRGFDPALADVVEPSGLLDVPDPYYGGDEGFDTVLTMIERAADGLVEQLRAGAWQR